MLATLVEDATWEQVTLDKSGAQVYRLHASGEIRYLKVEPRRLHGEPYAEAKHLRWLQGRLPVPALHFAGADERQSYLLTAEVPGVDAFLKTLIAVLSGHIASKVARGKSTVVAASERGWYNSGATYGRSCQCLPPMPRPSTRCSPWHGACPQPINCG